MTLLRDYYIARDETISDSQTKIYDLEGIDPISCIDVIYEATNGSTSNVGHPLHKDVSKIEVVDGSDVLFSLSAPQIAALDFYALGKYPWHDIREGGGAVQKEMFRIPFGRFLGDPRLYLNPANFKNPQLKCTHSLTISSTAGFATGTGKLTVIAKTFHEAPPPAEGFLMAKDIYDWTTASSGDEKVELPNDYPYRLLLLRAYESGVAWDTDITKVKLSIESDRIVPFELYSDDLETLNEELFGLAEIKQRLLRADNASPETFLAYPKVFDVEPLADLHVANVEGITADLATLQLLVLSTTPSIAKQTTAKDILMAAKGVGPHNVLGIPFGELNDPATWFQAQNYKKIDFIVTQGGAGATASVILQQFRR